MIVFCSNYRRYQSLYYDVSRWKDNMAEIEEAIIEIGKDVLVSLVILGIILGSLYVFSGRWPPMVVIETGSMMHSEDSQIGAIDPGDIVIVQERDKEDITTYVEGRATGYRKYGQYGDVIIFEPDGDKQETPIIHRAVLYLEYDEEQDLFNIPALGYLDYGEDWSIQGNDNADVEEGEGLSRYLDIYIYDYGHEDKTIIISLEEFENSGFITKGDNNLNIDQAQGNNIKDPVKEEWMLGRARGELPWFGIIKLLYLGRTGDVPSNSWNNFMISIAIILLLPIITEIGSKIYHEMAGGEEELEARKEISKNKNSEHEEEAEEDKIPEDKRSNRNEANLSLEGDKKEE